MAEVRNYEPRVALTPGITGLEAYRHIIGHALAHLEHSGLIAMETGIAQHEELARLFTTAGYARFEFAADLTGRPRYAFAWVD